MFAKCHLCSKRAGIWGAKRAGFVKSTEVAHLRGTEHRPWLNPDHAPVWICSNCLAGERHADHLASQAEAQAEARRKEAAERERREAERARIREQIASFTPSQDPVASTVWSWLHAHEGQKVKFLFDENRDGYSSPISTVWIVDLPVSLNPLAWEIDCGHFSGRRCGPARLVLGERQYQEVESSDKHLRYRLGYGKQGGSEEWGYYTYPVLNREEVHYWTTFEFRLLE